MAAESSANTTDEALPGWITAHVRQQIIGFKNPFPLVPFSSLPHGVTQYLAQTTSSIGALVNT
jgi:hypothetical protein